MPNLRCRPGNLARVIRSNNPALVGRIAVVERIHDIEVGRWEVTILGAPVFGITKRHKRPVITNRFVCRDTSLVPLRGDEPNSCVDEREVNHA